MAKTYISKARIRRIMQGSLLIACTVLTAVSCINDDVSQSSCPMPVRILTTLEQLSETAPITRAGEPLPGGYNEITLPGEANERAVATIRVIAFKNGGSSVEKNILYRSAGETLAPAGEKHFTIDADKFQMDMEIIPGAYEFVLVANEESSWGLSGVTTRADLSGGVRNGFTNNIVSPSDLAEKVSAKSGIPMIGFRPLTVPYNATASQVNPTLIQPSIDLKRTIAKAEVYITNIDPATPGQIYPLASTYKIKSVELVKSNSIYNVFEESAAPITESFVTGTKVQAAITHTTGAPFAMEKVLEAYMAERKGVASSENAAAIKIKVDRMGEEIIYEQPIYKKITNPDGQNYNIERNTLYRIYCYLNGTYMPYIEIHYSDTDWALVTRQLFMGYGYNVEVEGNKVTVSNTVQACDPHKITLTPLNGTTVNGGGAAIEFTQTANGASTEYTLANVPATGDYLKIEYNGVLVKTFGK